MSISRKILNSIDRILLYERGTVYKEQGGKIRIALIYPNTYSIGMSNLGFQGIYGMLNSRDDVVCERAFLPCPEDIGEYERTNSLLCSFESKRPINSFDIVAFSLSFENDYPNIVKILSISSIPIRSYERSPLNPLLIAGGPCCFINPEPVAEVFDLMFIGEVEESLPAFIELCKDWLPFEGEAKRKLKQRAVYIEGIYVPEFYGINYNPEGEPCREVKYSGAPERVTRTYYKDFPKGYSLKSKITSTETEFANMGLVEVMRGCYWNCRFCVVTSIYHPPRIKDIKALKDCMINPSDSPCSFGLIAPSISDVPYIADLLNGGEVRLSITSLRANARSYRLVDLLKDQKSVSIAPEAGNDTMRRVINKRITEQDILSISDYILRCGIETLRLYFMIGLPFERYEDVEGIVSLTREIRSLNDKGKLSLTISVFVPKPFTPFQWHGFADLKHTKQKLTFVRKSLEGVRNVQVKTDSPRIAFMQSAFARGGRDMLDRIIEIGLKGDPGYITKDPVLIRRFSVNWDLDTFLPWDFIGLESHKRALWQEYLNALRERQRYQDESK